MRIASTPPADSPDTAPQYVSLQAVLALYASGRTTGVVLDSGDGVSHAVPVVEGFALTHSITRTDIAGRTVTRQLQRLMRKAGRTFTTSAEFEVLRDLKESACYVAFNPDKEEVRHRPGTRKWPFALLILRLKGC